MRTFIRSSQCSGDNLFLNAVVIRFCPLNALSQSAVWIGCVISSFCCFALEAILIVEMNTASITDTDWMFQQQ